MLKKFVFILLSCMLFLSVYGVSHAVRSAQVTRARMQCFSSATMSKNLQSVFAEKQRFVGDSVGGAQIQIWASSNGKTWSLLYKTPQNISCLVDHGSNAVFL